MGIEFAQDPNSIHKPLYKKNLAPQNAQAAGVNKTPNRPAFTPTPRPVVAEAVKPQNSPVAQNTQVPNGHIPKPAFDAQRAPTRITARERKGPDHEGLQNILKEALGEALKAGAEYKKDLSEGKKTVKETPVEKPIEIKKTISLSELKKPEATPSSMTRIVDKNASEGSVSALQEAINRAKNNMHVAPSVVTTIDSISIETTPKPIEPQHVVVETPMAEVPKQEIEKEIPQPEPEITKAPEAEIPSKEEIPNRAPETPKEETPPKKVREVPEEVLRGLLE